MRHMIRKIAAAWSRLAFLEVMGKYFLVRPELSVMWVWIPEDPALLAKEAEGELTSQPIMRLAASTMKEPETADGLSR